MKLSVIIVNWRSKDYLRRCLQSLRATASDLDLETIVVDGASYDGCGEMLAEEFSGVIFVQSAVNLGFGKCNNLGFEKATGEAVLFLNPDTEVHPGCLQTMLGEMASHPGAGILCPRILNPDGSLQVTCVRALPTPLNRAVDSTFFRRLLPNSRLWGVGRAFQSRRPVDVEAVSGAFMLLRRETFVEAGGFSPEYFMYGEDMDLCAKVGRAGRRILFVPQASITHYGGISSSQQDSEFPTENMRVGWNLFMKKHYGEAAALRYRLLQMVSALIRMTVLVPPALLARSAGRMKARESLNKWYCVLHWAVASAFTRTPRVSPADQDGRGVDLPIIKSGHS